MIAKSEILMVVPIQKSFIKNDIEILSGQYNVILNTYNWQKKKLTPIFMILQIFDMLKHIRKSKAIIIQFGGYWAVVPSIVGKLFNTPVFIILHGTDCAKLPHIQYGSLRKRLIKLSCKVSYNLASMLLPVSDSLIYTENKYNSEDVLQGVKYHFPKIQTPFTVIHNGLDSNFWKLPKNTIKESKRFITVLLESQFTRKGGDLILSAAKKYHDCNFYIVGSKKSSKFGEIPKNVHFLGLLSSKELRKEFEKSQFYLQLSIFEGFGLSLCESMLCECIPIGSSVNVIPEIIGDTGFILNKKSEKELITLLDEALSIQNKKELGKKARERISTKYSRKKREQLLIKTIDSFH